MPISMPDLIRLQETLTSASGLLPLIPKVIDRLLVEDVRKYAPLRRAFARKTWSTDQYNFNRRTALPKAQMTSAAPALGDVAASNSTYVQLGFPIKHLQAQLDIEKFGAQIANVNGDVYELELGGAAKSMAWLEEMQHLWGCAGSTLHTKRGQWDGLDLLTANANKVDAASGILSYTLLDNAIDAVKGVAAQDLNDDWCFIMSGRMQSRLNRILENQTKFDKSITKIFARDDYGDPQADVVDNYLDAGIEVATYRNIPIVLSSWVGSVGAMGAVTAAAAGTDGVIPATTYYYVIEAITRNGITTASAEVSVAVSATNHVTLSWSTPQIFDADSNLIDVFGYRIFRGTTTGGESLYALCAALDASDNPITSFVDTGAIINPNLTGSTATAITFNAAGSVAIPDTYTFPRIQTVAGQHVEDIFLVPRNPEFALCPVVNETYPELLANVNGRTRQYALMSDQTFALRGPLFAAKIGRVRTDDV